MLTDIFQASIISQTGGTCVCQNKSDPTCATDVDYAQCVLGMLTTFVCREQTDHPRRAARTDYSDSSNIRARIFHVWIPYQPACSISVRSILVVQISVLTFP